MNREILLRGKREDNKEWVYGYLVKSEDYIFDYSERIDIPYVIPIDNFNLKDYREYRVIPETVSQYTGLTDKNGKKIFEGDILKSYYDKPGIVKWNNEICAFQVKGIPSQTMKRCYQMKVIGNIYESENKNATIEDL